ncbi:MAG TPA: UDP-N-acetylmuramoyl-L-alanyl-D-glutamate--2,6-diaminopimelate ligase [Gammaproteobacteria bacterium]|nr:UDP-N-acetylmuramoyl-L-alanyl-D-glutamate--2,6-diaminopimelate ligase [Gammaproteobacteria bacterium]
MMPAAATPPEITLGELMGPTAPAELAGRPVVDLTLDSRRIVPGALFLAVPGTRGHGLQYVAQAAAAGAALIAWEPAADLDAPRLPPGCAAFPVPGLRARLGGLADRYFGAPSRRVAVTGITGTNGKTTCTHLVAGALDGLGQRAGVIGTLGSGAVAHLAASGLTTPDVVEVHRTLAHLAGQGIRAVAMEVSSHALDQGRVDGVRFAVAAFTNLSRDHLDYHASFAAYGASKLRLFLAHDPATSVVNVADEFGHRLYARLPRDARRIAVSDRPDDVAGAAEHVLLREFTPLEDGLELRLDGDFGAVTLRSGLVGRFNAENLALSFAVLRALGVKPEAAAEALAACGAPAGRMEAFADAGRDVLAVVDYAHTPDALGKALTALRQHCKGRLWCVFGCGGDRDRGKRPEMARVVEQLADEVVITDDNPRREDGAAIVADILGGLADRGRVRVERDRAAAIRLALAGAGPGDVVLIAGKGHEEVQLVGDEQRPFSDRRLVAELTGVGS